MKNNIKLPRLLILKSVIALLVVALILIYSFAVNNGYLTLESIFKSTLVSEAEKYKLAVHFIDVGQGDSIYISCENYNILIDAGSDENSDSLLEYLEQCHIDSFDLVIATHIDNDHIGGMSRIIENYHIEELWCYFSDETELTDTIFDFRQALENYSVNIFSPEAGETRLYGKFAIDVLSPMQIYSNDNDNSIVVKAAYENNTFLFMGDATIRIEKKLLKNDVDVSADVIKLGHHGSKTSSNEAFLTAVNPMLAVISAGNNSYGLPSQEILQRLNDMEISYMRTDLSGTIIAVSDGDKLKVLTNRS